MNARKKAALNAKFEIVVFVDDDNILSEEWLIIIDKIFSRKRKIAIIGWIQYSS